LTEAKGIPISIEVAGANKNDFKLVQQTFENILIKKPEKIKSGVCMDKGYDYNEVKEIINELDLLLT
jgi:putative transposase